MGCGDSKQAAATDFTANNEESHVEHDLGELNTQGFDRYQMFEYQNLPFQRTLIFVLEDNINNCRQKSGSDDFILLEHMREEFDTPVWAKMINDDESFLVKLLLSEQFRAEGQDFGKIDPVAVLLLGILLCGGTVGEKVQVYWRTLQDEEQEFIAATDKDFEPAFRKMINYVSSDMFRWEAENTGNNSPYTEDDYEKINDAYEELAETLFLDEVFGNASKMDKDAYMAAVIERAGWVFNADTFRDKIVEKAEIGKKW